MNQIITKIRSELIKNADQKTKESGQCFFKEQVKLYGVKTALVSKISKEYFRTIKAKSKTEIFSLCEELWQSGYLEETFIACNWSYAIRKNYQPKDFQLFEKWVNKYINNWASCDTFCNHAIGSFIEMYPAYLSNLKQWTKSNNRWVRRASAVSLIVPAKAGKFLPDIFEIADILLLDSDDMVQKGYGWMLKVASQAHQPEIFQYVMKNKSNMPRTALRYAIEKMPIDLKKQAMQK
jgi:3-methyladenine DNA glycosylase AlkD